MHRIDAAGFAAGNLFTDGNPSTGTPATVVDAAWLNDLQENVAQLVEAAGIVLSKGDYTQLLKAVVTKGLQGCYFNIGTAAGAADAITSSYTPAITALANGMTLYVRAAAANTTTTPTFTPNSGTIAAKTIVKGAGAALAAGDIAGGGHWIELQYDLTLDKWVLLNPATGVSASSSASIQGAFKNLQVSAGGIAASVSVSFDELVLGDGAGSYVTERNVAGTITTTNTGAGGLDTGTLAASTWYSIWRIGKTDGTRAFLFSLSATAPTMPSGYTLKARIGWFRTDATNKYPLSFIQHGRRVDYKVNAASNVPNYPIMASGAQGSWSSGTWVAVAVGSFIPSTASMIHVVSIDDVVGETILSTNGNHGGGSSTTNPPPFGQDSGSGSYSGGPASLHLESTNIYRASHGGITACVGWDDNF